MASILSRPQCVNRGNTCHEAFSVKLVLSSLIDMGSIENFGYRIVVIIVILVAKNENENSENTDHLLTV